MKFDNGHFVSSLKLETVQDIFMKLCVWACSDDKQLMGKLSNFLYVSESLGRHMFFVFVFVKTALVCSGDKHNPLIRNIPSL